MTERDLLEASPRRVAQLGFHCGEASREVRQKYTDCDLMLVEMNTLKAECEHNVRLLEQIH